MSSFEREQRERIDALYDGIRFVNVGFAPGPVPGRRRFRKWVRQLEDIGFSVIDSWELDELRKRAASATCERRPFRFRFAVRRAYRRPRDR